MTPRELGLSPLMAFPKGQRIDAFLTRKAAACISVGAICRHPKKHRAPHLVYMEVTDRKRVFEANVRVTACTLCARVIGDTGRIEHAWPSDGEPIRAKKPVSLASEADIDGGRQ